MTTPASVHSGSVGAPDRFRSQRELEKGLLRLPPAPLDQGRVALIVRRGEGGTRETLERLTLTPDEGVPGDAWGRKTPRRAETQIAVMQVDVARLIANQQPLTLFGDELFLDLNLAPEHLPPGSRLEIGQAVLEVTPEPHNGCRKFQARFGQEALQFVSNPKFKDRKLRGIYMRVIAEGEIRQGDLIQVLRRGPEGYGNSTLGAQGFGSDPIGQA